LTAFLGVPDRHLLADSVDMSTPNVNKIPYIASKKLGMAIGGGAAVV